MTLAVAEALNPNKPNQTRGLWIVRVILPMVGNTGIKSEFTFLTKVCASCAGTIVFLGVFCCINIVLYGLPVHLTSDQMGWREGTV